MAIERTLAVALPPGKGHHGTITRAIETKTDFGKGLEDTVMVTIQPDYADKEGTQAMPVSFNVSPKLTGKPGAPLSALAGLYDRLGLSWDDEPVKMTGLKIVFDATLNHANFINIDKNSVTLAPKTAKK